MGSSILPPFSRFFSVLALCLLPAGLGAATLPAGFAETRVATGLNPVTMSFAPDGRLFLCEKHGHLRVILDGALVETPVLDLSAKIDAWNERGLLSVCFDPEFARNSWIYVYYTLNRNPGDASHASSHNRVSRFTLKGNVADPRSEQVLLELNKLSKTGWHNGGGLAFGKDGKLYISTGENANGGYAQDKSNLLGKLLRIEKDGSIPKDNPHYQEYEGENRAIVALGFRNPFSIAVQRKTGLLYLSDVGANFEQIEAYESGVAPVAVNYGWPGIDGSRRNQQQPPGYREPVYAYDHGRGDGVALCGGDFYEPEKPGADAFPAEYAGRFFFSDYKGWIKSIDPAKPAERADFAGKINRAIDVDTAPDGALWYIERAGKPGGSDESNSSSSNGSLWRVRWTGGSGGKAAKLAVIQQPANTAVGGSPGVVKVAVQDADGNLVSAAKDTIALSLDGAADALEGGGKVTAVRGIASFPDLVIGKPGRGYTLRASSGNLASASSNPFDVANQLAPPLITPPAGSFSGPVWVRISSAAPGATIHFTTDGKEPDASSATYTKPFQVTADQTIKAIALRKDIGDSAVISASIKVSGNKAYGLDTRPPVRGLKLPASEAEGLPPTLSATGIFSDKSLTPKEGVVPYSLNTPAWADGARARHWVILPESECIGFASTGEYTWPGGTIFVQHFDMVTNPHSGARRKLETRLLVLDASGAFGYGASYRWRADEKDADLVDAGGAEEVLKISGPGGTRDQTWSYPARGLCYMCHTQTAGFVLGPKTRQLNGEFLYPNGRKDNQLRTWNYLQMFSPGLDESAIPGHAAMVKIQDTKASLETRVRSYLDANCAACHRPAGTGASWDARFDTPLAKQNIINGDLREIMGITGAKVVVPGDPAKSMLHLRMNSTTFGQQMPPVGRSVVDVEALQAVEQWIREAGAGPGK